MDIIDEQGRILGLVNIIDALVVLLVVAVVVAGVALVLQEPQRDGPPTDNETRYATISFGAQSSDIAGTVSTLDRVQFANGGDSVNITDLYRAPRPNGNVYIVARVSMTGRIQNDSFVFGGNPIRIGNAVKVVGDSYAMKGRINALSDSGTRLPASETTVVIQTTAPTAVVSNIHEGDIYRIGSVTAATVETVNVFPTGNPDRRRLMLGVRLRTLSTEAGPQFAGQTLRVGQSLALRPEDTTVNGRIVARGTTSPPGEAEDVTAKVAWHNVRPAITNAVTVGMTEQLRETTTARVVGKHVTPETTVVRADNGTLHLRDHTHRLNVTFTMELAARRTDDGILFQGRRLQIGRAVVLDFGTVTVRGRVIAIDSEL